MTEIIVDTTILIDASNELPKALHYLDSLFEAHQASTHAHAAAEVLSGTRDSREQRRLLKMLRDFSLHHPNEQDSRSALNFLTRFHLSNNVGAACASPAAAGSNRRDCTAKISATQ
jgi:hypothetical protein